MSYDLWAFVVLKNKKCDNATDLCLLCNFEHEPTLFTNFTVVGIIISWQKADFKIKMVIEFSAPSHCLGKTYYVNFFFGGGGLGTLDSGINVALE